MIRELKIYDVGVPKIRLGHHADGGYVLPVSMLAQSEALFSYGVGTDITFEMDYSNITNKKSYSYDHTIEDIFIPDRYKDLVIYKKEGLASYKDTDLDNFFNQYTDRGMTGRVLLKMDIEQAEYEFFLNTDIEQLSKMVTGMVVEFHIQGSRTNLDNFFKILKSINQYFIHCHLHGNNYLRTIDYEEEGKIFDLPEVMEITFINKSLVEGYSLDMNDYPNPCYDGLNEMSKPDVPLDFLKVINQM